METPRAKNLSLRVGLTWSSWLGVKGYGHGITSLGGQDIARH